jgi:hypothetical protein
MGQRLDAKNWLPICFIVSSSTWAFAGQTIEQSVKVNINDTAHTSIHNWYIENEKFELTVNAHNAERRFIFNGKVMYVCGRLDVSQQNIMNNLNLTEQALFKKYKDGVCQEVPSNFLVRFFLSPVAAIETIDLSDGLKLTLEIENFKLSETQKKKIADMETKGFSRSYTLKRTGSLGKTVHSFQESFFNSIEFKPRQNLWNEIAKNLMRQPKGRELMKELKKDRDQVPGLILESETIIEATLANGGKSSGTISVITLKSGTSESPVARFKIPQNYELFSAESLKLVAKSAEKKQDDTSEKKSDEAVNLMDKVQSTFFCAIAGAFACFSK